jgi:acyl carrier protein
MITVEEFTRLIEKEFDDIEVNTLHPNINYRDIPDFSSMHALIIIALIDNHFDVLFSGQDLKSTQTINDLYQLVLSKMNR